MRSLVKTSELALYDLVKTHEDGIGVITNISKRGITIATLGGEEKIFCKDIKRIRFVTPKCLAHGNRFCEICGQYREKMFK